MVSLLPSLEVPNFLVDFGYTKDYPIYFGNSYHFDYKIYELRFENDLKIHLGNLIVLED